MIGEEYIYITESNQEIPVYIVEDCNMVHAYDYMWHKVIARPIGFNNAPLMILDFNKLLPRKRG